MTQWNWTRLGLPGHHIDPSYPDGGYRPTTAIIGPMGALTVRDTPTSPQRPYVFVTASPLDSRGVPQAPSSLWAFWWDGGQWRWSDQSVPPEGGFFYPGVALTVMDTPTSAQRPYVFMLGDHYHRLFVHWWDGGQWHWSDHGLFPIRDSLLSAGALTVMDTPTSAQRPYLFLQNSSGLWAYWWGAPS